MEHLSDAAVERALAALLVDQQRELGAHINPLVLACRNQTPQARRAALYCMVAVLATTLPELPLRAWLPGLGERRERRERILALAAHRPAMEFCLRGLTLEGFLCEVTLLDAFI